MAMMSAARLHDPNQPFKLEQVPMPEPRAGDVLVRVRACGVVPNLANVIRYREILPELPLPEFPAIFGLDAAGEIAAVGSDVLDLAPGQRVYVNPGRSCESCLRCRNGRPRECSSYAFAGYFGFGPESTKVLERYPGGGFAEYLVAPASSITVLPDEVTFEEAARFGYLGTALEALTRGAAGPDTTVLINGATGTLGAGAVLMALALGAPKILAVARSEERLADIKAVAPNRIVTYSNLAGPCTEWAREQTGGWGPDVVMDAVSPGAPPEDIMPALMSVSRGGRIIATGGSFIKLEMDPIWIMVNQITYLGALWFTTAQADSMARMVAAGVLDLKPLVHRSFPLDQVSPALEAACNREHGGLDNVVVTP